jgi:multiple sugar transport system substrate-binding protein
MSNHYAFIWLTRFLLAVLLLGLLASCSPPTGPAPDTIQVQGTPLVDGESGANPRPSITPTRTPTPQPSRLKVSADDLDGVKITFWHALAPPADPIVEMIVADFNRKNEWGIQVEAKMFGDFDELAEAVGSTINDGTPPDITVAYHYQAAAWDLPGKQMTDLSLYANDPVWGFSNDERDDFIAGFLTTEGLTGKSHGIPAQRSAMLIYYNLTWAKELGFSSPPRTPAEFQKQACAAAQVYKADRERANDGRGGWMISTNYSAILGWLHAFGAEITPPSKQGYSFNTPAVQQTFRYLRELYEQGCAWLPENLYPEDAFANRQGLFATGSVAGIPYQETAFVNLESEDEWTVIPFPASRGDGVIEVYGPDFHILSSKVEHQLAAWLLVKWMLEPENQARLAQADAWLPVRTSGLEQVDLLPKVHPQWQRAAGMLPLARNEPQYPSWKIVRWGLSDSATQLFRSYFTLDQLLPMLKLLDETASDFQNTAP